MNCGGDYSVDIEYKCGETDVNGYVYTCHSCKDELIVKMFGLARFDEPLSDSENLFIAGAVTDQGGL